MHSRIDAPRQVRFRDTDRPIVAFAAIRFGNPINPLLANISGA